MANGKIPLGDLPVKTPGDFDYLAGSQLGDAYRFPVPEVTNAARLLSESLDQVVADAEADIAPVIAGLGYQPPVPYASGLNVNSTRFTVIRDGQVYAPAAPVPFTTGAWDAGQWRLIQGVTGGDLASEYGAAMVGMPGGLKLSDVLSVRWSSEDPSNLGVILGDQEYSAAEIGKGSVLIGAYSDHQSHRMPETRQLRTIVGGYDCEITAGTPGDTGGLACAIFGSHHSEIQGDTTHGVILGGSNNKIHGGDYGNIVGGSLNELHAFRRDGVTAIDNNTSTIAGGYGNSVYNANSVIGGGRANSIDGVYAFIGGGNGNIADGNFSVVVGGGQNEVRLGGNLNSQKNTIGGGRYNIIDSGTSSTSGVIAGGESNSLFGHYGAIGGGRQNAVGTLAGNSDHCVIAGGYSNTIAALNGATISGGRDNSVTAGTYGTVTGGRGNLATKDYARAGGHQGAARHTYGDTFGAGAFATAGDAQASVVHRKVQTTAAGWTPMTSIEIPDNSTCLFDVLVVARSSSGESAAYRLVGCADRGVGAASAALVGTVSQTVIGEDSEAWDGRVIAQTGSGGIQIQVAGEVGKTIRWVARATLVEVSS